MMEGESWGGASPLRGSLGVWWSPENRESKRGNAKRGTRYESGEEVDPEPDPDPNSASSPFLQLTGQERLNPCERFEMTDNGFQP